ncbi:unnamed protein product [Phytomonas sp. Hart1]|nr:unnamed protein product [Phytomonas sp. Hart1]|eukprot:CCW69271.1 unnamed protein product [Phytomonas sp. isolate Hart1]
MLADGNAARMRQFDAIQKLTKAVDALVARRYAVNEKHRMLDQLETFLNEFELCVGSAEGQIQEARAQCVALQAPKDLKSRITAGSDAEVEKLWKNHGQAMADQLARHSARLKTLQAAPANPAHPERVVK